jgi:outer membrane lipoprotein-sorting protein
MRRLRTTPTRNLVIAAAAVVAVIAGAGIAQAQLSGSEPKPEPKALDQAVYDAVRADEVPGVTARVEFVNNLIPAGSMPQGTASPLYTGADGRLWLTNDGKLRVELQSEAGDAQIVSDGKTVTVHDSDSNTVYRATIPQDEKRKAEAKTAQEKREHGPPTLQDIQKALQEASERWTLSGAEPTNTGGEPSYTVRISPKDDGGLLGAAELAWDAANGTPLRAAVYADGQDDPVLELKATEISYASVPAADVTPRIPPGAEVIDVNPRGDADEARDEHGKPRKIEGIDKVREAVDFDLAAPDQLAGLPRQEVGLVETDKAQGAVVTYGEGLGAIVVIQKPITAEDRKHEAGAAQRPQTEGDRERERDSLQLPTVNIDGATGTELATALGTVVTFERDGIEYVVAGSVPPQAAEQAARDLG